MDHLLERASGAACIQRRGTSRIVEGLGTRWAQKGFQTCALCPGGGWDGGGKGANAVSVGCLVGGGARDAASCMTKFHTIDGTVRPGCVHASPAIQGIRGNNNDGLTIWWRASASPLRQCVRWCRLGRDKGGCAELASWGSPELRGRGSSARAGGRWSSNAQDSRRQCYGRYEQLTYLHYCNHSIYATGCLCFEDTSKHVPSTTQKPRFQ